MSNLEETPESISWGLFFQDVKNEASELNPLPGLGSFSMMPAAPWDRPGVALTQTAEWVSVAWTRGVKSYREPLSAF